MVSKSIASSRGGTGEGVKGWCSILHLCCRSAHDVPRCSGVPAGRPDGPCRVHALPGVFRVSRDVCRARGHAVCEGDAEPISNVTYLFPPGMQLLITLCSLSSFLSVCFRKLVVHAHVVESITEPSREVHHAVSFTKMDISSNCCD